MMIFGVALANITHKLDSLGQRNGENISSHVKLKEEGLACLKAMIEEAPASEYLKFLEARDHAILLAYCLNLLCHYSKSDKSKNIRNFALEVMFSLMERLERIHAGTEPPTNCSIKPVVAALPGVSSTLFHLIMSDTKMPRSLLVNAVRNLTKLITMTFLPCEHQLQESADSESQRIKNICDNLAVRLNFLIDYTTNYAAELPDEMLAEVLELCHSIVSRSHNELLLRSLGFIVKYLAFLSAEKKSTKSPQVKLRLMLLTDCIREKVQDCDDSCEKLDSVIISGIIKVLDNLETNAFLLLAKERQSELAILLGFLRLLPEESLTTFLEIDTRRKQIINLLIQLSEFSASQPFLLLTDSEVNQDAVQISASKIYSIEKRFKHLAGEEISLISDICQVMGFSSDWLGLNDMLMNDLRKFSDPSNLHITHLILRGLLHKNVNSVSQRSISRFTAAMLAHYIDSIQAEFELEELDEVGSLKIVIAIESIATLVEIHLRFIANKSLRIIIFKDLLCPLLKWASSSSRAVSEAALSALTQLSQIYEYDSTKSLIEDNIDYIVNGVMQMLENFYQNCDVTHVLAITFKLSSISSFYYFRDIFERLFRILAIYQHSEKAQSILLLFYKTLATITDWKQAQSAKSLTGNPLEDAKILKTVIHELSIERRLKELAAKTREAERYKQALDEIKDPPKPLDEAKVLEDIKSGNLPEGLMNKPEDETSEEKQEKKKLPDEILLTERILTHCISMMSSDYPEVKILALRTAALGFGILSEDENTLLPLVHKLWTPLEKRLVGDYGQNLEVSLCAFECLVSMAENAKDFIKRRTLDSIIPRICLFLETQAKESRGQLDYGAYGMSVAYKCQLKILTQLGALAYHIDLAYRNLWRVVRTTLIYMSAQQMKSLRQAAASSLNYMIALDADCVWYFAKQQQQHQHHESDLPFDLVFQLTV